MHLPRFFTLSIAIGLVVFISACDTRAPTLDQVRQAKEGDYPLRTQHFSADGVPLFTNRLILETSPYLLQHAHNPVDWWAWSDAAFETAKQQDKPILLSIGYSTCHWCHVMERESFENTEIADFINQHFIAIKVDREEHPDIDETYLTAVQMLSGKVGWPLTAVLTPNAEPFFGGTYFAPEQFLSLLNKINQTWIDNRPAIQEQAARLKVEMSKLSQASLISKTIDEDALSVAQSQIARDLFAPPKHNQPGFPREPEMLFLMQRAILNADASMLDSLRKRLLSIANGGIHDQVGGGFHRYSVDSQWRIPHFEKMLYNQAQLGQLYALAYQYTGDARLKSVSEDTFNYMLTELANEQRGFYAAMDAESGGAEGGFYIWSYAELSALLSGEELTVAERSLGVSQFGNFDSANVLQRASDLSAEDLAATQIILQKLLRARQTRTAPNTDTKVITAWNGMAISALIAGFHASHNQNYRTSALATAEHLWDAAYAKNTGLLRNSNAVDNPIPAALDDYAFLINAFIDLYDLQAAPIWLARAEELTQRMRQDFYDPITGGFFISNKNRNKDLVVSLVVARDDALYSGNSMAAQALARLYRRTGNIEYRNLTRGLIAHFSNKIVRSPMSSSGLWLAASMLSSNEVGETHYAARGKVKVQSTLDKGRLAISITVESGWHINAHEVLSEFLIPTSLTNLTEECSAIGAVSYPNGQRVTLGFQAEPLLVYENTVGLEAVINPNLADCALAGLQLKLQACSDQVCLEPESIPLRFSGNIVN